MNIIIVALCYSYIYYLGNWYLYKDKELHLTSYSNETQQQSNAVHLQWPLAKYWQQ